jgi:hypothetical protein
MSKEEYRPQIHQPEAKPQASPERQPQKGVFDIMGRRAQLRESWVRFRRSHKHQHTREYLALRNEHLEKVEQLGDEVASLYPKWPSRDRLIFDLYTTVEEWRYGLPAQQTQQFIAKVQPLSDEGLAEELRTAREALERKAARYKKSAETRRLNSGLTPEERERLRREKKRKYSRTYQKDNKDKVNAYHRRY